MIDTARPLGNGNGNGNGNPESDDTGSLRSARLVAEPNRPSYTHLFNRIIIQ